MGECIGKCKEIILLAKKVYILGAGTSKADGMPMQSELLRYIFEFKLAEKENIEQGKFVNLKIEHYSADVYAAHDQFVECRKELAIFLLECFGTEQQARYAADMRMYLGNQEETLERHIEIGTMWERLLLEARDMQVTLEDIFTILDKTVIERRHFTSYSNENIKRIKWALQECIIFILSCQAEKISNAVNYSELCKMMLQERLNVDAKEDNLAVITLNWDSVFEKTLMEACQRWNEKHLDKKIFPDLCFYDYTFENDESRMPSTLVKAQGYYNLKLLKLHGSINWLVCPKCGRVYTDYRKNIALKELGTLQKNEQYCRVCKEQISYDGDAPCLESLIITPTYLKEFNNLHLQNIWHNAYIDLTEADEIVFIGYSLPDADFEMKNLLKRAVGKHVALTVVLRKEDNPQYYYEMMQTGGLQSDCIEKIIQKMRFPCQNYNSLFSANNITFYYGGLEKYLREVGND